MDVGVMLIVIGVFLVEVIVVGGFEGDVFL